MFDRRVLRHSGTGIKGAVAETLVYLPLTAEKTSPPMIRRNVWNAACRDS